MANWSSFEKRILINKNIEAVYNCWTTQDQIETWFLEKADYYYGTIERKNNEKIKKGDKFSWKWNNWDIVEEGEILEANGNDFISFTFGSGGDVQVYLKEVGDSTEVKLIQDKIPTDDKSKMNYYVGCSTGWTFWLTNLKAYLEYGITLHAKELQQNETDNLVNS